MSEIAEYRTEIRFPPTRPTRLVARDAGIKGSPCHEILKLALEKVIRDHGGALSHSYLDNAGRTHKVLMAVCPENFHSGIGVQIQQDGRVTFHYDTYARDAQNAEQVCREIRQTYTTIALLRSLNALGFSVEAYDRPLSPAQKVVLISGKKWSGEDIRIAVDEQASVKADFGSYQGGACTSDESVLRALLREQDLVATIENISDKPDDGAPASWGNISEEEINYSG